MIDSSEREFQLSDRGRARRDAMLADLLDELAHRAQRRRIRRAGMVGSMAIVALLLTASLAYRPQPAQPAGPIVLEPRTTPAPPHASLITRISTAPDIRDRYAAVPHSIIQRIDDERLLSELESLGQPSGIIRIAGKAMLASR